MKGTGESRGHRVEHDTCMDREWMGSAAGQQQRQDPNTSRQTRQRRVEEMVAVGELGVGPDQCKLECEVQDRQQMVDG